MRFEDPGSRGFLRSLSNGLPPCHHPAVRRRRVLLTLATTVLLIAAIAAAGFAWFRNAPRRTPAGQSALTHLDAATLPALREAFNASSAETRVLLFFSPT